MFRKKNNLTINICAMIIVALWVFPLLWIIISSFKPSETFGRNIIGWFFKPTLEHYIFALNEYSYMRYLINSLIVSVGATALSVTVGTLAGYSLARYNTGGQGLSMWILASRMMPPAASLIPFFMLFNIFGILDTKIALILSYLVFNLSFTVWMARSFFKDIPVELEEAALIDGCSYFQAFLKIITPLARTGLMATTIFSLIFSWNEYLFATVLTSSDSARTLPASVGKFVTHYQIIWGPLFAQSTLIVIPVLIAAILLQPYLIRGVTLGALK